MFGCCVWWIFFNYFTVTRLPSTNSQVAANLQKVIHVLVGLMMQRTSCQLRLCKAGFRKLKRNGIRNCKSVTCFYCYHRIHNFSEFSCAACVCSLGLPKSRRTWSAQTGGFISRAAGFTHVTKNCSVIVWLMGTKRGFTTGPNKQLTIHAVEGCGSPHIYTNL